MKLYLNKSLIRITRYEDFFIVGNRFNGNFLFISLDIYEMIKSMDYSFSKKKLVEKFCEKDREYVGLLIDKMYEYDLIQDRKIKKISNNHISKIILEITNKCNLKCKYCCMDSNLQEKDLITKEEYFNIINKLVFLDPKHIVISGGEPMLRDDIIDIVKYLKKSFKGYISLATNLTYKINNLIEISKYVDSIDITLDGYNEETCSKYRGKGVFDIVDKNIDILKQYNSKISASMIVDDYSYLEINNFIEYCKNKKIKHTFKRFLAIGRGSNKESFLQDKNNIVCMKLDEKLSINTCNAGLSQIFIDNKGNIYPCPLMINKNYFVGNVLDLSVEEIVINSNLVFNKVNEKIENHRCKKCEFYVFCSPCPAIFNEAYKKIDTMNYYCAKRKKILKSKCEEYLNGVI